MKIDSYTAVARGPGFIQIENTKQETVKLEFASHWDVDNLMARLRLLRKDMIDNGS